MTKDAATLTLMISAIAFVVGFVLGYGYASPANNNEDEDEGGSR